MVQFITMNVLVGFALASLGAGLFCSPSYTLILFPDALARTAGNTSEVFSWSEVKELYTFINRVAREHRIVAQDGRRLEIDAKVKDGKKLGLTVQQTLFVRMRPGAVKAFEAGETLTFGNLRVDQNFLYYKDKRLGVGRDQENDTPVQCVHALAPVRG